MSTRCAARKTNDALPPSCGSTAVVNASGQLHRPVIVAMIAVRVVQPAVYKIVDMVTMRHHFMSAVWTVCV
jgi:hypothetical protein